MIAITEDDFDPGVYIDSARTRENGGIVSFTGIVRDDGITAMETESVQGCGAPGTDHHPG